MKPVMVRFVLRLPDDMHDWLKALAEREGRSLHGQILHMLRQKMTAETTEPPY
jgi:hypothetical protein